MEELPLDAKVVEEYVGVGSLRLNQASVLMNGPGYLQDLAPEGATAFRCESKPAVYVRTPWPGKGHTRIQGRYPEQVRLGDGAWDDITIRFYRHDPERVQKTRDALRKGAEEVRAFQEELDRSRRLPEGLLDKRMTF